MISSMLQRFYIAILNPIFTKHISKMDPKLREAYLKFIFCLFEIYFILYFSSAFKHILNSHTQRGVLGAGLLVLAIIFSMNGLLHPVRWKKRIFAPIVFGAFGLIVTGILHPIGSGYMSFGFILLLVYPGLYFVWNNRKDYETLFDIIANANIKVGMLFFLYCIVVYWQQIFQADRGRFQGPVKDPNLYSLIGMAMVCSAMYMIYRRRAVKRLPLLYITSGVMGFAIIVFGQSRSGLLVGLSALILTMIYFFKNSKRMHDLLKENIATVIVVSLTVFLCANALMVAASAASQSEASPTSGENFVDRFSFAGKDLNTFTSGRIQIWANYAEKINWYGNDFSKTDWTEMTGNTVKHAHNNFLEYGYRCGIPTATVFFLLELFAGLLTLKYLFSRNWRRDCYLYAIICMFMYAVMSMIDIATIPMERYAPFAFYIVMVAMIDADENNTEEN